MRSADLSTNPNQIPDLCCLFVSVSKITGFQQKQSSRCLTSCTFLPPSSWEYRNLLGFNTKAQPGGPQAALHEDTLQGPAGFLLLSHCPQASDSLPWQVLLPGLTLSVQQTPRGTTINDSSPFSSEGAEMPGAQRWHCLEHTEEDSVMLIASQWECEYLGT